MLTLFIFGSISFLSFFLSTMIPLYLFKNGIQKANLMLILGISAGILFGIATLDLIPEAIELTGMEEIQKTESKQPIINNNEKEKKTEQQENKMEENHSHQGEQSNLKDRIRLCMYGVASGMITLSLIGKIMSHFGIGHSHASSQQEVEYDKHSKFESEEDLLSKNFSFTAIVGLFVHSIIDGLVIGGTFSASQNIGSR